MEQIRQEITLDDSQYGEAVQRIISGLNEIGDSSQTTSDAQAAAIDAVNKAFSDARKEVAKTADANADLADENKKVTETERKKMGMLTRLANLYKGPYRQSVRNAINTLEQWRKALGSSKADLEKSSDATTAATKPTTALGMAWQALTTGLTNRFPKATKAVVGGLRAIKVALISTGIGAIIVLIGVLIGALVGLSSALGDTSTELSKTDRIANAFRATFGSVNGLFQQLIQNGKDVINGQKSMTEALKANIEAFFGLAKAIPASNAELNKAEVAALNAAAAQVTLNAAIAGSKDELNKQREAAADANKSTGQRVAAIKQAAEIEFALEQQRLKVLEFNVEESEALFRSEKLQGRAGVEAAAEVLQARNELALATADANARQRADQGAINNLYREGAEQLRQFRKEYADMLKDLSSRLQDARLDELVGAERIKAELDIAIQAINDFEQQTREAAKKARQAFDAEPFGELRLLAEKQAALELRKFEAQDANQRIEAEKQRLGLLGQTLSASFDDRFNLEEARQAFILEAERTALEERLAVQRDFYTKSGELQTAAAQEELAQLELNIELVQRKEADLLKKAQERSLNDRLEGVQLESEISELQLELIRRSGDRTLTLEQFIEQERLKLQADAIEKRIALLLESGIYGPDSIEIRLLEAQLANIKAIIERGTGDTGDAVSNFLKKTFGIDDDGLAFVTSQFSSAFSNISAAAETFTRIAIEQGRRRVDALNEEIKETQSLLEQELEDKEAGYENNYTLYKDQLTALTAERDRVQAETLEKEKRAANAQLAINSALQVSEFILATISFFKEGAKFGPIVGIALALGAIGILASTIAQARANAEQFKAVPEFHEGGPVQGALHGYGGKRIEVEGREFVIKGDVAQRHGDFLHDLNAGRFQQVDLAKLMESRFDLAPTLRKMEKDREVIVSLSDRIDYGLLEQMYARTLSGVTDGIISYLQTRPIEKLDKNGEPVKEWREGNNIRRQRVRKQKTTD